MRLLSFILSLTALLNVAGAVNTVPSTDSPTGTFESAPCMFEVPLVSFLSPEQLGYNCGYVTVPERHADPTGPLIKLPVAILSAAGTISRPDPLFLAQGGPGGDAFQTFALIAPELSMAADRDIVIFNQRGTLHAKPSLVCIEVFDNLQRTLSLPPDESVLVQNEAYGQCRDRLLAEQINLSAFNSLENAADVDAIRQALGYDEINFYGVSYGTLLGLHLMRDYPDHLRTVILDSVVPTQLNYLPLIPQVKERIFKEMFTACGDDTLCNLEYPDLENRFTTLIDRLNTEPITIPVVDPNNGETIELFVDGSTFIDMLFLAFYLPEMYAIFPRLVADMEAGRYDFWQTIWPQVAFDRTFSEGMFFSVLCAEDSDFNPVDVSLDGVRPQIAATAVDELQEYKDVCDLWPVQPLPPSVDEPVSSNVPTLLLAGQFDPITPPSYAAAAAQHLSNSYLVTAPTASHGVAFVDSCVNRIVQEFLDHPDTSPDPGCLSDRKPAGFLPANARVVKLIGQLNLLETSSLVLTGVAGLLLLALLSTFITWPLVMVINHLRGRSTVDSTLKRWLGWLSKGLVVLFGFLAIIFVAGLSLFFLEAFDSTPLLIMSAVSGYATPLFILPWLLLLLAIAIVGASILIWVIRPWSIWSRLYYTFVAFCVVGYVLILYLTGMMTVLI